MFASAEENIPVEYLDICRISARRSLAGPVARTEILKTVLQIELIVIVSMLTLISVYANTLSAKHSLQ